MKNDLPKYLLLSDPYLSIGDRILIMRVEFPCYIFELNRPDDENSVALTLHGREYHIVTRSDLNDFFSEFQAGMFREVIRWYHFSKTGRNEDDVNL